MNKKYLILSVLIIFLISFFIGFITFRFVSYKKEAMLKLANEVINKELNIDILTNEEIKIDENMIGILKIPKINLEAPIQEGTKQSNLRYSIGHFTNSSLWCGNVALASHNRGSFSNYFARINELTEGNEIIYKTRMGERRYKVQETKIIESTDWSVISNTTDNKITLITCVKNKPNYRFCVIGIEK